MAGGNDNLIPMNERTKDEQREIARKGGKASGEARRRKRTLRQIAEMLADETLPVPQPDGTTKTLTYDVAMIQRQYQKAIAEGDTQAAKFLTNLLGEENVLQQTINVYNVKEETAKKMQDLEQMDV
jgi:hypothetical protein